MTGPAMFVRFGYPPNALGYCGPSDATALVDLAEDPGGADTDLERLIAAFSGAWPYLELIAGRAGLHPLDERVVEAYWLGNSLLDEVDTLTWGNSLNARFRRRAGWDWDAVVTALNARGVPNHAFHVFCVYPWVGLLRDGATAPALRTLELCRIRWGRVESVSASGVLVTSRPLTWDGLVLALGSPRIERVDPPLLVAGGALEPGDRVAMHWNYVCQTLTGPQWHHLRHNHARHLALVNSIGTRLGGRLAT